MGGTAIEYALIAALIAVVVLGGVKVAADDLEDTLVYVGDAMVRANGGGGDSNKPGG